MVAQMSQVYRKVQQYKCLFYTTLDLDFNADNEV